MKKFTYYLRLILFIAYLIILFLMIDNFYSSNFFITLYFILNALYSFIIILTIISKKNQFKETISYNILNMGISIYTIVIYIIVQKETKLEIINNEIYFRNNFIMLSILLLGLTIYSLYLNKEMKKNDKEK